MKQYTRQPADVYPYWMWEADVIDHVQDLLQCPRGDAQAVVEAQEFYMAQSWGKGLSAQATAKLIEEKSKA
jgi:hypothetical protein